MVGQIDDAHGIKHAKSPASPAVKTVRALLQKKHRAETGLFLAEGLRILSEAVDTGHAMHALVILPGMLGRFTIRAFAAAVITIASGAGTPAVQAREFTDSAGRAVALPEAVETVYPSGHPAAILLYTLAPESLLGWTRELPADLGGLMPARYHELPVIGRLGGRGDTANLERVLRLGPDVILDYGAVREPYTSMADRLQQQTGIPNVLLDGRFNRAPSRRPARPRRNSRRARWFKSGSGRPNTMPKPRNSKR